MDWLVEMNRFPQEALFDRLASRGRLDLELMAPLATAIAEFHMSAEHRADHGGKTGMTWVIQGNAAGFAEFGSACLDPSASSRVADDSCRELDERAALLDRRRESGFVRQCHGDLHLRNIVLLDGRPTLFDGVEFNDEISCTDVLYDLAFLLMDLWRRRLPRHANAVWSRYLAETDDLAGVPLLPLFLSCRAAVRAKTSATAAQLQKMFQPAVNFTVSPGNTSPWRSNSCILLIHPSLRSGVSRAEASRPWLSVSHPSSAQCLARSSCGATRFGSACPACRCWNLLGQKDIHRRCPNACTRLWQSGPL